MKKMLVVMMLLISSSHSFAAAVPASGPAPAVPMVLPKCDVVKALKIMKEHKEYTQSLADQYESGIQQIGTAMTNMVYQIAGTCALGCTFNYAGLTAPIDNMNQAAHTDAEAMISTEADFDKQLRAAIIGCK